MGVEKGQPVEGTQVCATMFTPNTLSFSITTIAIPIPQSGDELTRKRVKKVLKPQKSPS